MHVPTVHHIRPIYIAWFTQLLPEHQEAVLKTLELDTSLLPATPVSQARMMNFIHNVLAPDQNLLDKLCVAIEVERLKTCADDHRKEMQ